MPVLSNPRHEKFSQELAKGQTPESAYEAAGFKPARQNAHRLMTKDDVAGRVRELQERAAAKTELTVASITERLIRIADEAQALGEASGLAVARASMMDAAKLNGLIVERTENVNIEHVVSDDLPTADEWEAEHGTAH
jgi:phage terminase small subunit